MFFVSFVGVVIVLFALTIMDVLEKRIFKERALRKIELLIKKRDSDIPQLKTLITAQNIKIVSTGFERNVTEASSKITFLVGVTSDLDVQQLSDELEKYPGMVAITFETMEY